MTRRRLLLLALIVLLLGLIGGAGVRGVRRDREARATADSSAGAAGVPGSRDEPSPSLRRSPQGAGAAEAKLKSLLAVREGEMAFIRMPPALLARLMASLEESGIAAAGDLPAGPSPVGVISRTMVQQLFAGTTEGIEGSVDLSGEDFEWNGARMQVRGTTSCREGDVQLKFKATEGGSQLECETSLMPGSVFLLRASDAAGEGLLLVIGQNEPAEVPAGE